MSLSKSVKSKTKKVVLPSAVTISLKKSECKKTLFSAVSKEQYSALNDSTHLNDSEQTEKPKRRKLRRTETSFYCSNSMEETLDKKTSFSVQIKKSRRNKLKTSNYLSPEISSNDDSFTPSGKGSNSSKKKIRMRNTKLPKITLDDFECEANEEFRSDAKFTKKQKSMRKRVIPSESTDPASSFENTEKTLGQSVKKQSEMQEEWVTKESSDFGNQIIKMEDITKRTRSSGKTKNMAIDDQYRENTLNICKHNKSKNVHHSNKIQLEKHSGTYQLERSPKPLKLCDKTMEGKATLEMQHYERADKINCDPGFGSDHQKVLHFENVLNAIQKFSVEKLTTNLEGEESIEIKGAPKRSRTFRGPINVRNTEEDGEEYKENISNLRSRSRSTDHNKTSGDHSRRSFLHIDEKNIETLEWNRTSNTNRISEIEKCMKVEDGSSDSEVEFSYKPVVPSTSDFDFVVTNMESQYDLREENLGDAVHKNKADVASETTIEASANVIAGTVLKNLENNSMLKEGGSCKRSSDKITKKKENLEKRHSRKRWSTAQDPEAMMEFKTQIQKLKDHPSTNNLPHRQSLRKRWSDEIRMKSLNALDVSENVGAEKETHLISSGGEIDEKLGCAVLKNTETFMALRKPSLENNHVPRRSLRKRWSSELRKKSVNFNDVSKKNTEVSIGLDSGTPTKSRRSKSLTNKTTPPKNRYWSTPYIRKGRLSKAAEPAKETQDEDDEISVASKALMNNRRSRSSIGIVETSPAKMLHRSSTFIRKANSAEVMEFSNISQADNQNTVKQLRNQRRSRSLADSVEISPPKRIRDRSTPFVNKSRTGNLMSTESMDVDTNRSRSSVNEKCENPNKRRTYELDESVTDVSILKNLSIKNNSKMADTVIAVTDDSCSPEEVRKVKFQHVTLRSEGKNAKVQNEVHFSQDTEVFENQNGAVKKKINKGVSFDLAILSPPSSSSTPKYVSRKPTLLKTAMNNVLAKKNAGVSDGSKIVGRIKMPNFAKIHKKNMDQMENIAEMAERKAERARLLLSGQKPIASSSCKKQHAIENGEKVLKKSHKRLAFGQSQLPISKREYTVGGGGWKNLLMEVGSGHIPKSHQELAKNNPIENRSTSSTGFLRVVIPERLKSSSRTGRAELKTIEIKSITTKTKPHRDSREERRTVLKGVRGNRRFDLLMKMRKQ